jgi:uncharacterized protein
MIFDGQYFSVLLLISLPIIAFLYASVGHGGASGYLALMGVFAFPETFMKPTALLLNILVASLAFYFYYKENHFKYKLFYPFALTSVPFSFLGGYLSVSGFYYKIILATALIFAVLRLLGLLGKEKTESRETNITLALCIGAIIGLLSGLIGIGGGIILSPILIILGWASLKEAAAVSALFILVNSISGILGFWVKGGAIPQTALPIILVVFVGGILGAFFGSKKFESKILRNILAVVLTIAIYKLYATA